MLQVMTRSKAATYDPIFAAIKFVRAAEAAMSIA
jgi:hypothetical protein